MNKNSDIIKALRKFEFGKVIDIPFSEFDYHVMDFSVSNPDLHKVDLSNTKEFNEYVFDQLSFAGAQVGYGGYNEDRVIYKRSNHFQGEEPRSVHLGIDLWVKAHTNIFAPLDSTVHSYADNKGMGNYGPTIILEHKIDNLQFYTLYGHLTRQSLAGLKPGLKLKKGDKIGQVGNYPENGDWPPHLHFQIITDMVGMQGDFPGVAKPSEREKYLGICPDPKLILGFGS